MKSKTITVWSGSDLYACKSFFPTEVSHNHDREYIETILCRAVEDFGAGVKFNKVSDERYEIDVGACHE